jgi:CheY-specific phosphatase CheX
MNEVLSDRIAQVLYDVFEKQAFMFAEPALREPLLQNFSSFVRTSILFEGEHKGQINFTVPQERCFDFTMNIVGSDGLFIAEEDKFDALKELLNIFCGNLLIELFGSETNIDISIPQVELVDENSWQEQRSNLNAVPFLVDNIPLLLEFQIE